MDSRDSSPRSRDIDNDNPSLDEQPPSSYKVKLMCSYGGKIQPRPHHNNLTYVAGDTKILSVERSINFSSLITKLSSLTNATNNFFFKYQLPGEDLDALISVTNDEDLHHMMLEYDRLYRTSPRPARLRLFLFPLTNNNSSSAHSSQTVNFGLPESKPERQWFVDALNSVQVPILEGSSPPPMAPPANPDFLFGLDKPPKPTDFATVTDVPGKESAVESENFSEDRRAVRESESEILELHKLQLVNNEQISQRKIDDDSGRRYGVDSFAPKNSEKVTPLVAHAQGQVQPVPVHGTVSFVQERNFSLGVSATGNEPVPVYFIQTPSGIFQAVRPMTGPVGQPVYLVQTPGSVPHSAHKVSYGGSDVGVGSERGYSQVSYLNNERSGGGARW
ncbi:uncharacterized protein LOC113848127 [Abrus precatorius]|uniref:Uncharacterized protein LOC113848127 n=1 Tax=Abrus precatorius TaxID=3816 RepID=A0A8B8JP86_ABRPR|nr:uncharacterized protein LOC113848127 [Abrus precatorius]